MGPHTLTLLRLADGNMYTFLDGVVINTMVGTTAPADAPDRLGIGQNEINGNAYIPIGSVVSKVTVFNATSIGGGSDYTTWADGYLPADVSDPAADNDGDGLSNQQEYAFGLNPTSGSSVNPITVQLDKTTGMFTYTRRATPAPSGLTYTVLTSTDLLTWTPDTGATEGTITTAAGVETVPVTISVSLLSNPKLFVRVQAAE